MIVNIVSILAIVGMLTCLIVALRKSLSYLSMKSLSYFLPLLTIGVALNLMAILIGGVEPPALAILHSIGLAVEIFKLKISVATILALATESILFQIAIWLYDLLAIFATVALVVSVFFHSKLNDLRVRLARDKEKCILIGDSDNLSLIFKDLIKNKTRIIFVAPSISKESKKKLTDNKILYFEGAINNKTFDSIGTIVANKSIQLISIFAKDNTSFETSIALSSYFETQKTSNQEAYESCQFVGVFFYTKNERTEHFHFAEKFGGRIKYVSKYDLLARKFIMEHPITQYLPTKLIDEEKAGLVSNTTLSHIFVGLGNANIQMLKKVACSGQFLGVDFNAYVFDKKLNEAFLAFCNDETGFCERQSEVINGYPLPSEKFNIIEKEINVVTSIFYNDMIDIVQKSDFTTVYICLGEDLLNLETAMELRQQLVNKKLIDKIKLFFKSKKKVSNKYLEFINTNFEDSCRIEPFAENEEIFTANMIINEKLDYIAKRINNIYNEKSLTEAETEDNWKKLSLFKQDANRYSAYGIRVALNLLGYDIVKDGKNSGFDEIKAMILTPKENELIQLNKQDKSVEIFVRDKNGEVDKTLKRNNLARLEHLRWDVYFLASGWKQMDLRNIYYDANAKKLYRDKSITKEHSCLTTFEGLDILTNYSVELLTAQGVSKKDALIMSETIKYDYNIIDNLGKIFKDTGCSIIKLENR